LALAAEPLVSFFQKKLHLPRGVATGLGVCMTLVLLGLVLLVLGALLLRELRALAGVVPDLENAALQGMVLLEDRLLSLAQNAPEGIGSVLTNGVQGMFSDGTALLDKVTTWLLGMASGILSHLPDSALGFFTWILAGFMISAKLPKLRLWLRKNMPTAWQERYFPMVKQLKKALFGWMGAQFRLIGITFLVLTLGFFALQITYGPVWALMISLMDALPVLGTDMALIPWSLVCFLQGDHVRGIGLLGVYVAATLLRSVMEPRLVGKQLGLDPLVTLIAMYAGYRLWGLVGMILSPVLAMTALQLIKPPNQEDYGPDSG